MTRFLNWLFVPEPGCGPLCRDVQDEIQTMRQADRIEAVARTQRHTLP